MVAFFGRELQRDHWMVALSPHDPIAADPGTRRDDHGWTGAYNAWPATFAPDMWSHQYDQQANQVLVSDNQEHMWSTNGPQSNLYGLEPNFGCCTANMHMGWPKLVSPYLRCAD